MKVNGVAVPSLHPCPCSQALVWLTLARLTPAWMMPLAGRLTLRLARLTLARLLLARLTLARLLLEQLTLTLLTLTLARQRLTLT